LTLNPEESRVLGTLIEKAQTVPGSYPMTLNSLIIGCNQKNNREPVTAFDEDTVYASVDSLRKKGIVREVDLANSRVQKFRHVARDAFKVTTEELVLLAELLLRGPQSIGALRGNASRMTPTGLETLEQAQALLNALSTREIPLVKLVPAPPGSRAALYVQLLCPDLHIIATGPTPSLTAAAVSSDLAERVQTLEADLEACRAAIQRLASRLGETDPFER